MWPDVVVVRLLSIDGRFGVFDAGKPVQIETIRCELAVEALHTYVLSRLAGLDEVELHNASLGPAVPRL